MGWYTLLGYATVAPGGTTRSSRGRNLARTARAAHPARAEPLRAVLIGWLQRDKGRNCGVCMACVDEAGNRGIRNY